MSTTPEERTPVGKGTASSRWVWLFPCGCVIIIVFLFGGVGGLFWHNMSRVRQSEVYDVALNVALNHPKVAELLGSNCHPSGWAGGSVDEKAGRAEFGFVLESHRGGGKVACVMEKREGTWVVVKMTLQVSGSDVMHVLIAPP